MLKNFFIVAIRNIRKNKGFSLINLFGLSIGMAAFILIAFYISDEFRFDRFLAGSDRIFLVTTSGNLGGQEIYAANTPPPVGNALTADFPGVESSTRLWQPGDVMISHTKNGTADNYFTEQHVLAADSNFFQLFRFPFVHGDPATALNEPNTIVLTENSAKKYFGKTDVIGEILEYGNGKEPFKVTGVVADLPKQSSLQFDFLVPMQTYKVVKYFDWSWVWLQVHTFVKLSPTIAGSTKEVAKIGAQSASMVKRHAGKAFARIGMPMDEFYKKGGHWDFNLQPYTKIHLYSDGIYNGLMQTGSIKTVTIFGIIAAFIVLLACVNFMNLSTAKSFRRARETGVRKVLGSSTNKLILQFLAESVVFSVLSAILAIVLVALVLPSFNALSGKAMSFSLLMQDKLPWYVLGLVLFCGLLAGSYPAFYLSSFKPIVVLKSSFSRKGGNYFVRNALVVFQFTVSVALIICTLVVYRQLQYTREKDLGLDKENVLMIANAQRLDKQEESFREEMLGIPGVKSVSITTDIPTAGSFGDRYLPEKSEGETLLAEDIALQSYLTDEQYITAMGMRLLQGRDFSKAYNDSASVILNETAVHQIGWKHPLGQTLVYPGNRDTRFRVIGVVKDFDTESIRNAVAPFALFHYSSKSYSQSQSYLVAKLGPGSLVSVLSQVEEKWKKFVPGRPFDYSFLDARISNLYQSEQQMGVVFIVFAILSVAVACLGLLGLTAFAAEQRTKEIGIRKVLGASVGGIVQLLSKDFLRLVLIASIIAFPVAWWAMHKWLEDFAYKIAISWWIFVVAAFAALVIALATISFQSIKAALLNPVESLKNE